MRILIYKDLRVSKSTSGIEGTLPGGRAAAPTCERGRMGLGCGDSPGESITGPLSPSWVISYGNRSIGSGEARPEALATPAQRTRATQTVKS
jgi:hypothetical protein